VAAGHETVGIDATPAMLDIARTRAPGAQFRLGDLTALPVGDADFDFAICALALAHLRDPAPAIAELARAVRPGGRIVLTDAHPTFVTIQGQATFPTPGGLAFVRNHPVMIGAYLAAFRASGLTVLDCLEGSLVTDFSQGMFAEAADAATALFEGVPVALVWSLEKPA
jgi:ubiquinone/menaquinone biosynthesis C-methylase UbiE